MNLKLHTVKSSDDKPYNIPVFKQEVISFGLYVKSDYNNLFTSQYHTYTGYDAKEEFIKEIIRIYNDVSRKLYNCSQAHKTVKLTLTQQKDFNQATHCYICNREFPKGVSEKLTEGSEDITEALSAEGITSSVLKKRNKKLNKVLAKQYQKDPLVRSEIITLMENTEEQLVSHVTQMKVKLLR